MFLVFKFFFFKKASTQSENYLRVNNLLFLVYLILYLHLRNYQAKSDPCEWLILEPGKFHKIIKRWILTLQHWPKITCRNVKCWVAMASVICHTIWVFMFSDFKFLCHFSCYALFSFFTLATFNLFISFTTFSHPYMYGNNWHFIFNAIHICTLYLTALTVKVAL